MIYVNGVMYYIKEVYHIDRPTSLVEFFVFLCLSKHL